MKTYYVVFALMIGVGIIGQFNAPWMAVLAIGLIGLMSTVISHIERIATQ